MKNFKIVEKHIALGNQKFGYDIDFSIKGNEIKKFKNCLDDTYNLLGKKFFFRSNSEKKSIKFRRSIFVVKNIKKGEKFTNQNIRRIRPGYGLSPIFYEKIIGKKALQNLSSGIPFKLKYIK